MTVTLALQYFGVFVSALVFEYAYLAWIRSATSSRAYAAAGWGMAVAGLSLVGVGGSLTLPYGYLPYLAGVGAGSYGAVRYRM